MLSTISLRFNLLMKALITLKLIHQTGQSNAILTRQPTAHTFGSLYSP